MLIAKASRARNGYNSNGTEGDRRTSSRWFEKWGIVFSFSNCPAASQVKFVTCTLQDDALTWWNAPRQGHDVDCYSRSDFMPTSYVVFQNVSREIRDKLMEDKTHAYAERQAERKRKNDDFSRNNQNQQVKRQNTGQAYTAGNSEKKSYAGSKPLCARWTNGAFECGAQGPLKETAKTEQPMIVVNQAGNDRAPSGRCMWLNAGGKTQTRIDMEKGFPIFLALITTKEVEGQVGGERLEDVQLFKTVPNAPLLWNTEGSEDFIAYCDASKKGLGLKLLETKVGARADGTCSLTAEAGYPCYGDLRMKVVRGMGYPSRSFASVTEGFASIFLEVHSERFGYKFGYGTAVPITNRRAKREEHSNKISRICLRACATSLEWCRSPVCWTKVGEAQILGPELIQETTEQNHPGSSKGFVSAFDRQKSYVDLKRMQWNYKLVTKS
ncbi:hypothetical protein Tco_1282651 [Tanacetum coccineum]